MKTWLWFRLLPFVVALRAGSAIIASDPPDSDSRHPLPVVADGERILRISPDEISRIGPLNRRAPLSPRPLPVANDGERVPKRGEGHPPELSATALREELAPALSPRAAELYQSACGLCHGPDGRLDPASPRAKDFVNVPADFTDPLFNSREPFADWFLVVKHGGMALGLSSQMPAYGEAYSDDEIRQLVGHIKSFAGDHGYPPGDLNFFRSIRTKKAFPEDEVVLMTRFQDDDGEPSWKTAIEVEKRVGKRHQVSLELIHEIEDRDGKLTGLEFGWKTTFHYNLPRQFIASGGAALALPLRSEGQVEAVPFLAAAKGLSDEFTLQASVRSHLPFEEFEDGDFEASAVVHWLTTDWPRGLFPAFEVTARAPFERGANDGVQVSFVPQLHAGLSKGGHVRMNLGVELPATQNGYDYRVHFNLIWDWADGPFWRRW
jgi:mono/diheme cytochrome c family protein